MVNQRADQSLFTYSKPSAASGVSAANAPPPNSASAPPTIDQLIKVIRDYPEHRGQAINALSKIREDGNYLATAIWNSPMIITILLQEVIKAYRFLSPLELDPKDIERVCDTLALFTFVASHKETRKPFMNAHLPVYLYPFLSATVTGQQESFLKLASLGVIASMVQDDDPEAVLFLQATEVFPQFLQCLEHNDVRLNILAARIISKILAQNITYICDKIQRFQSVVSVLGSVVDRIDLTSSSPQLMLLLLRAIISCYFYLSTEQRLCGMLKQFFPAKLRSDPILSMLRTHDSEYFKMLEIVVRNIINA